MLFFKISMLIHPSGVEFAAELRDLVKEDLKHLYPELIDYCKVTLVEALPQILNAYDEQVRVVFLLL